MPEPDRWPRKESLNSACLERYCLQLERPHQADNHYWNMKRPAPWPYAWFVSQCGSGPDLAGTANHERQFWLAGHASSSSQIGRAVIALGGMRKRCASRARRNSRSRTASKRLSRTRPSPGSLSAAILEIFGKRHRKGWRGRSGAEAPVEHGDAAARPASARTASAAADGCRSSRVAA